uniref:Uncharacterized protein n=1 Tax=Davidia involucrata TaxID=16924 RepID=A0A5B6YSA5_DAVIN
MAAVSSNRSPSPVSTRQNPNSRTSESNSTVRRSFSGNPFSRPSVLTNPKSFNPTTPANSPADFARRHSVGKEGMVSFRGFEEKENEKDQNLKPGRVRSPAVSKGTKNFMSPTISAASKITASPRKKALAERNELVRTSDGKSPFASLNLSEDIDSKSDPSLTSNQNKIEASCDSETAAPSILKASKTDTALNTQVPLNSQNASESLSETITMESDCTCVDTSSNKKPPCPSAPPIIAPLDADPSLPPYDPKTNYLSPRPQFLHYKPNSRIELHLDKEKGLGLGEVKGLEDSFIMSETFSDTEVTEETQSLDSQKESEDASSAEVIIEEEPHVSEPKPISNPISSCMSKETVEAKRVPKLLFFTRSKSISLLLVLLIACLSISVTDSPPVIKSSVYKDLSFSELYDPSDLAVFATTKFNSFARNFKQWSANSISYLSNLISILGDVDELGPLQFANLTALQEDLVVDGYRKVDHSEKISEESYQQDELEQVRGGEVDIETLDEKGHPEVEAEDNSEDASEGRSDPEIEVYLTIQAEVMEAEALQNQEQTISAFHITSEPQTNMLFEDHSVVIPQATEIQTEVEASEIKPEIVESL